MPYARGSSCEDPELEQILLTCTEQALILIKARRFAEARAQFELAVSRVRRTQETIPNLHLNLLLFARLLSHYGALLIRSGEFAAAGLYLAQARECLDRLTVKALLKGAWRARHRLRMSKGVVDLEHAYLALRRRAYPQALALATRLLSSHAQNSDAQNFQWLQANAHLVMGWAHYEQRQYPQARAQVIQALALEPALEEAEPLDALTQIRLLHAAGRDEEVLAKGIAGCQRLLSQLGIDCPDAATQPAQLHALMRAVSAAQRTPPVWARVMPEEREEIGEFLVVLGVQQHAQGCTTQALDLFLLTGSLLPPADEIDIPEFELLTRELGEQARREPRAFATLRTLLRSPHVLQRWEFLEAVAEAVGRVPLGPALASVAALKARLPGTLPADTRALIREIQTDLERTLQIDGETARTIGVQVLSNTSVRFVVTTAFPLDKRRVLLDLMEAVIHCWQPKEAGMADPEPSTPETEYLTDVLEDDLVQRFTTPATSHMSSTAKRN
jgi:tetratricopeptide (TPR) repeat protein